MLEIFNQTSIYMGKKDFKKISGPLTHWHQIHAWLRPGIDFSRWWCCRSRCRRSIDGSALRLSLRGSKNIVSILRQWRSASCDSGGCAQLSVSRSQYIQRKRGSVVRSNVWISRRSTRRCRTGQAHAARQETSTRRTLSGLRTRRPPSSGGGGTDDNFKGSTREWHWGRRRVCFRDTLVQEERTQNQVDDFVYRLSFFWLYFTYFTYCVYFTYCAHFVHISHILLILHIWHMLHLKDCCVQPFKDSCQSTKLSPSLIPSPLLHLLNPRLAVNPTLMDCCRQRVVVCQWSPTKPGFLLRSQLGFLLRSKPLLTPSNWKIAKNAFYCAYCAYCFVCFAYSFAYCSILFDILCIFCILQYAEYAESEQYTIILHIVLHTAAYYLTYSAYFAYCNMQNMQNLNSALLFCILFCILYILFCIYMQQYAK